jgi:hypothetical protein
MNALPDQAEFFIRKFRVPQRNLSKDRKNSILTPNANKSNYPVIFKNTRCQSKTYCRPVFEP